MTVARERLACGIENCDATGHMIGLPLTAHLRTKLRCTPFGLEIMTDFNKYFKDPHAKDGYLRPGMSGIAVRNLRLALELLDYPITSEEDHYDKPLIGCVKSFQIKHSNEWHDARCGPGTRGKLIEALTRRYGDSVFQRFQDPTNDVLSTLTMLPLPVVTYHDLHENQVILHEYKLEYLIAGGGFGRVWRAIGPGGIPVAMKFLELDKGHAEVEAESLQFMKFIKHPHLIVIFGIWNLGNMLVIGMELSDEAGSLLDRLSTVQRPNRPGLGFSELIKHMHDAAEGIDYLNEPCHTIMGESGVSIRHRDIKPHNLLIVGGRVKVADYSLSLFSKHNVTYKALGGTISYAAPEFFKNEVAQSSDQYSLAVTYCQLRSGRLPFSGTEHEVIEGHLNGSPDLSMIPPLERPVVERALAKAWDERWPSCRHFVKELQSVGR